MTRAERIKAATDAYNAALYTRLQTARLAGEDSIAYLEAGERLVEATRALGAALVGP